MSALDLYNIMCVFLQHAFQIDALILKDLLKKYLPNISLFMDVSVPRCVCIDRVLVITLTPHPLPLPVQTTTKSGRSGPQEGVGPSALLHRVVHEHIQQVRAPLLCCCWIEVISLLLCYI